MQEICEPNKISKRHYLFISNPKLQYFYIFWHFPEIALSKGLFILIIRGTYCLPNIQVELTLPLSLCILFLSFSIRVIKCCLQHNERCGN